MKRRIGAREMLYPMPAVLVCGGTMDEADVTTVAWIGIASATPPTVAVALRKTRRVFELIDRTGEFSVNVPSTSLAREVDACGLVSGRDVDKFERCGLTKSAGDLIATPLVEECPLNLECSVRRTVELGEYRLVLGEILETHMAEEILDERGDRPVVDLLDPLVYCPTVREYRGLSGKLADAYTIGRELLDAE